MDEDVKEYWQNNVMSFVKGIAKDGGYSRFDVSYIAYKWRDIWGQGIIANPRYAHTRRAFYPKDLKRLKVTCG